MNFDNNSTDTAKKRINLKHLADNSLWDYLHRPQICLSELFIFRIWRKGYKHRPKPKMMWRERFIPRAIVSLFWWLKCSVFDKEIREILLRDLALSFQPYNRAEVTANLGRHNLTLTERHVGSDLLHERFFFKSQVNKRKSNRNRPKDIAGGEAPCY